MKSVLTYLEEANNILANKADLAERQYQKMINGVALDQMKTFSIKDRVDVFWYTIILTELGYHDLWSVVVIVMSLSHGNARVESEFSVNKDLLPNLRQSTMVNRRTVYTAVEKLWVYCPWYTCLLK